MWYRNYLFFYKHCILYPNKIVFLENFPALTSRAKPHQLMCCRWMMVMIMAPALQQQHPTCQPASHPGGGGVELGASTGGPCSCVGKVHLCGNWRSSSSSSSWWESVNSSFSSCQLIFGGTAFWWEKLGCERPTDWLTDCRLAFTTTMECTNNNEAVIEHNHSISWLWLPVLRLLLGEEGLVGLM